MDRHSRSQVLSGVLLIVLGLVFLGDRLDVLPALDMGRLWPLILIVLGVGHLVFPREDGRRSGGWFVFVGVLFLLHNYRVLTLHQSWPLFIVAGGLSILFGRSRETRMPRGDR